MTNLYAAVVRRAVESGSGPPHVVRWVAAQARRLAAANGGAPVPADQLAVALAPAVAAAVASVARGRANTLANALGDTACLT